MQDLIIKKNCKIIEEVDYLMYKHKGGIVLYNEYKNKCNNTKCLVVKK